MVLCAMLVPKATKKAAAYTPQMEGIFSMHSMAMAPMR